MLPRLRRGLSLMRPLCHGALIRKTDLALAAKQSPLSSQQGFLHTAAVWKRGRRGLPNTVNRVPGRNGIQMCRCSTSGSSPIDDGLKSDAEDEFPGVHETQEKYEGEAYVPPHIAAARLEIEVLRSAGSPAPSSVRDGDLEYFASLTTKKSRKRFLAFLAKKERQRLKEKEKRRQLRAEREALSPRPGEEDDLGAELKNRLLLQVQPQSVQQFDNWRLAAGMQFGPRLAFDFSYEEHMRRPELISLVQQLMVCQGANKLARDPFHIHWTGLQRGSATAREMRRMMGSEEKLDAVMVSATDRQVQDVFPTEDIVYLTADSPKVLRAYDPSKVYVVGALVDSHKVLRGVSFARVKRHGLDHAHLPLDLFLRWSSGGKNLTLDQVMRILVELNDSGDWVKALGHVPTRKHSGLKSDRSHQQPAPSSETAGRESPAGQEARYSSSRARHARSWPLLDDAPFQRSKKMNSALKKSVRHVNHDEDDPVNETTFSSSFSSSGGYGHGRKTGLDSDKDKPWYKD